MITVNNDPLPHRPGMTVQDILDAKNFIFRMLAVSVNVPCWEFALRKKGAYEESATADSQEHLDNRLIFYGASIIICVLALVLWLPHYCLFSCEIVRSPLEFFSHTFTAR